jgi:hypothetical protein
VGWGDLTEIDDNLYEGAPAEQVDTGRSILRTQDSDDNAADFIDSVADFHEGIPVPLTASVSITMPAIEISPSLDLSPEDNLVIKNNGDTAIDVEIIFNDLHYLGNTIPSSALSGPTEFSIEPHSEYSARIQLDIPPNTVPGTYTSTVRVIIE